MKPKRARAATANARPSRSSEAAADAKSHLAAPKPTEGKARANNGHGTQAKRLRFAALRRVSTEQQEKDGESLRTQTNDIQDVVTCLGGVIVEWYGGQEHATPGHEKKELHRLLSDAQKTPSRFDAVIVAHPDRWSRDNTTSRQGLEVFKEQGIRFFAGATEYDLFNPDHELFLGISAVVGQFHARNQMRKSFINRLNRAKRGIPTGGRLPYGRNYIWSKDRHGGHWEIDAEKKRLIQDAAKRYLAGESFESLAIEYDMNASNLHKVLTKVSGSEWQIEFSSDALKIHEVVKLEIPPLLDDATIQAVRAKAEANRTFTHGKIKHDYLFARMISCSHCGYTMFGQTNHNGRKYYRHIHKKRDRECPGPVTKSWIPAAEIEKSAMNHLFETFGNPAAVRRAIEKGTPNNARIQEAVVRLEFLNKQLAKLHASRQRLLDLVIEGTISEADVKTKLTGLSEREEKLSLERSRLDDELAHIPSRDGIRKASDKIVSRFRQYASARTWAKIQHANTALNKMTYDEKRELCQTVFSGKTADGQRMGIWISWDQTGKNYKFRIVGHFIDETGPIKEGYFEFGSPHAQKALVTKSASR